MAYISKKHPMHCHRCNNIFLGDSTQKYCSQECRVMIAKERYLKNNPSSEFALTTGTKGAINELMVCIDLLKKGYEVFRAVSPSCSCDIAILKNEKLYRVEVTSGWKARNDLVMTNKGKLKKTDVLATVCNNEIYYTNLPCLEEENTRILENETNSKQ